MSKLLDILLCGGITIFELITIILAMVLIQFMAYRIFNINIYKTIVKSLNKFDRYLSKVF